MPDRFHLAFLGLLVLVAAVSPAAARAAAAGDVVTLDEVRAGMTGFGLSVFAGSEPERFEVEALGVWRNLRPGASYILARLSGRGLEESGVIAGMSGSPVFLDGRLAGAVAFAWPFSLEPIAGITPIESMREIAGAAEETDRGAPAGVAPSLAELAAGRLPIGLLSRQLGRLRPRLAADAGPALLWSAAGFGPASRELLTDGLGVVASAGNSSAGAEAELTPGAAVAGLLVDGDLRLAATGTVTDRQGDELLAFGHPFLGLGAVRVPMATAEVITVLPNQLSSFKIANVGKVVGAFHQDRVSGVRGRLGMEAPTTPLTISVRGERSRRYELRLAKLDPVAPSLVAVSTLASLESATRSAGSQGLDLEARFDLDEVGELRIRQSFDGPSAASEAAMYLMAFASYLMNNPLREIEISSLEIELTQAVEPRTARLVEAHAASTLVRPGDRVRLNVDLVAYRGERFRRSIIVNVPTGLPDGRYSLLVGDGVSVDVARLSVEPVDPVRFSQAFEYLRSLHSRRELVVLGLFAGAGLSVAGEALPQLPGSMRSIWAAAGSTSAESLRLAVAQEIVMPIEVPVEGIVRVDLEVRRKGPLTADEPEPGPGESGAGERSGVDDDAPGGAAPAATGGKGGGRN